MWWQKRFEVEYNSRTWIILRNLHRQTRLEIEYNLEFKLHCEFASAKRDTKSGIIQKPELLCKIAWATETRKENSLGDQIILKVLQWQTRPDTEYNLEANYIEGLHLAKRLRVRSCSERAMRGKASTLKDWNAICNGESRTTKRFIYIPSDLDKR